MLKLSKFIGKGATRICFEHPEDKNKCVKVPVRFKENRILKRELETYQYVKIFLNEYIVKYEEKMVETNQGKGIVCEILRDDSGEYSQTLDKYYQTGKIKNELKNQIKDFAYFLLAEDIFFYDFNLKNFMVQKKKNKVQLKYIDLKSFENYKPWTFLHLEKIITPLGRILMIRRLKKLFKQLGIEL